MLRRPLRLAPFYAALVLAWPAWLHACTIPVFRYGLDRWGADAFVLQAPFLVLGEEPMASDFAGKNDVRLNLEGQPPPLTAAAEPEARLLFPPHGQEGIELWKGLLDAPTYRFLTQSPARSELIKRVVEGDSGVWVLVECGEPEADEAAAKQLTERMAAVEKTSKLPVIDPADPSSQLGPGPELKIKFSLLRVSRKAPEEQMFLKMLAGPNGMEQLPADQPFAALVFGRGRVLGVWAPERLTDELIDEASRFLLGACSCEAKHLNPGWDLLLRVNWEAELEKVAQRRLNIGELTAAPLPVKPETVTFQPASSPPVQAASLAVTPRKVSVRVVLLLLLGTLSILLGWKLRKTR